MYSNSYSFAPMFQLPAYISHKQLFGSETYETSLNTIPVTRIGAGKDADVTDKILQNAIYEEILNMKPFEAKKTEQPTILPNHSVLLYRKFVHNQQPCSVCERPMPILGVNSILACAHLVHPECHEEALNSERQCARCEQKKRENETKLDKSIDNLIIYLCCLWRYK